MTAGAAGVARRLFFASWPDATTRDATHHATRKAVRQSGGRPVATANLHLTLAFLGSVGADRHQAVCAMAGGLAAAGFEVVFDRVEVWSRPKVVVATASDPPPAAAALAARLWAGLVPLGFEPDLRPYRPHLTLARKVSRAAGELAMKPVPWPVRELALVESVTDPAGARYTVLERWPLAAA